MLIILKVKDTDNIIGLKEDIAARLEGVADIQQIDIIEEREDAKNERKHQAQADGSHH